jgi:hypothetical protein
MVSAWIRKTAQEMGHEVWQGRCAICRDMSSVMTQTAGEDPPEPQVCDMCRVGAVHYTRAPEPAAARRRRSAGAAP